MIDGVIIPKNPFDAIAGGSAAGIPLLHGTTKDEFRYWIQYEPLIRVTPPETFFKYVPNFSKPFEAHQDRIIAHYKKTYPEASGGNISMMLTVKCQAQN